MPFHATRSMTHKRSMTGCILECALVVYMLDTRSCNQLTSVHTSFCYNKNTRSLSVTVQSFAFVLENYKWERGGRDKTSASTYTSRADHVPLATVTFCFVFTAA